MESFPTLLRKDHKPIRYLVVDDSVFARKNVAKMVESFGGEIVGEAGDGCTAITEYDRTMPDMVLMDITMPQMEGIEAAERIVRSHPDARIVMVSSVGYQENIVAALQKGARHFVQKPVKSEILYEVIKYVMGDDAAVATPAAARVASYLTGSPVPESDEVARETVCELANMVIGSAITSLNNQGFKFKIYPPVIHADELGEKSSEDQEALVMCFDTDNGNIFMNIAMRYNRRRRMDTRPI